MLIWIQRIYCAKQKIPHAFIFYQKKTFSQSFSSIMKAVIFPRSFDLSLGKICLLSLPYILHEENFPLNMLSLLKNFSDSFRLGVFKVVALRQTCRLRWFQIILNIFGHASPVNWSIKEPFVLIEHCYQNRNSFLWIWP